MRIYTRIIFDPVTLKVIDSDWYESDEPVIFCKKDPNKAYNRQMAAIAARQQKMAEEFMAFWREYEKPAAKEFIAKAREGVDVGEEVSKARAEYTAAFTKSQEMGRREAMRYGIDPSSARFQALERRGQFERARGLAGVTGEARRYAEAESFRRLGMAGGIFR